MSSFEQTRKKIKWNFENSQANFKDVNRLEDFRLKFDSSNFNKKFTKYTIKENIQLFNYLHSGDSDDWSPYYISFDLQNFTDAFIRDTKVVSVLKLEDGFHLGENYGVFYTDGSTSLFHQFNYWFTKIAENNYKLQGFLDIYTVKKNPDDTGIYVPVYWDLYLYTYNFHNWQTIQRSKT